MSTIRILKRNELYLIHELAHDIWPKTYSYMISAAQINYMLAWMYNLETLTLQYDQGHYFALLADDAGQPIGFAGFHNTEAPCWRLEKLYVKIEQQGKGAGAQLLNFVESQALKQGAACLKLNVNRNNKAIAFYQRHNFKIVDSVDKPIGANFFMNDFIMEKKLV